MQGSAQGLGRPAQGSTEGVWRYLVGWAVSRGRAGALARAGHGARARGASRCQGWCAAWGGRSLFTRITFRIDPIFGANPQDRRHGSARTQEGVYRTWTHETARAWTCSTYAGRWPCCTWAATRSTTRADAASYRIAASASSYGSRAPRCSRGWPAIALDTISRLGRHCARVVRRSRREGTRHACTTRSARTVVLPHHRPKARRYEGSDLWMAGKPSAPTRTSLVRRSVQPRPSAARLPRS